MPADIKTLAYVLRRTNYGEADRILNLITPGGKVSAIARGVRKARSKLASGVEMFTLSEMMLHVGRGELAVVTGARMRRFYGGLLTDLERMEVAVMMLKRVNVAAEGSDSAEFFELVDQGLSALNRHESDVGLVTAWFLLNLARVSGEQVNLYRDTSGAKLAAGVRYEWNAAEEALEPRAEGAVDTEMIKLMRLMLAGRLEVVMRVKGVEKYVPEVLKIARAVGKM